MQGYERAVMLLPETMRQSFLRLSEKDTDRVEELRLRTGEKPTVLLNGNEREISGVGPVTKTDLFRLLELATQSSPYAAVDAVRQGYVTAPGAIRVGLCGQVRPGSHGAWALSGLTSAAIRIPREVPGCAKAWSGIPFVSTLIISPPGGGKTTFLRDMVRALSDRGKRVGLCDEREEVAALTPEGTAFSIGRHTDVLSALPKAQAALQLVRTMNPEIIAMDEISASEDRIACRAAFGCGVRLLATAHGESREDLLRRPGWRQMLSEGLFSRLIVIQNHRGERAYREECL